jgi:hypothetical protein
MADLNLSALKCIRLKRIAGLNVSATKPIHSKLKISNNKDHLLYVAYYSELRNRY